MTPKVSAGKVKGAMVKGEMANGREEMVNGVMVKGEMVKGEIGNLLSMEKNQVEGMVKMGSDRREESLILTMTKSVTETGIVVNEVHRLRTEAEVVKVAKVVRGKVEGLGQGKDSIINFQTIKVPLQLKTKCEDKGNWPPTMNWIDTETSFLYCLHNLQRYVMLIQRQKLQTLVSRDQQYCKDSCILNQISYE